MREIKFRGMQLEDMQETDKTYASKKGTWRYGSYKYIHKFFGGVNAYMICDIYGREIMCDKNTIGQYTGLKDKNGVEIYEGDIVCYEDGEEYVVIFTDHYVGSCGCCYPSFEGIGFIAEHIIKKDVHHGLKIRVDDFSRVLVKGNIHEKESEK